MNCETSSQRSRKPTAVGIENNVQESARFLKGFASPHRLAILCHLVEGEQSVSALIDATGIAQTSMSQHLSRLKEENIVTCRREHRTLYYRISHKAANDILKILHKIFCQKETKT